MVKAEMLKRTLGFIEELRKEVDDGYVLTREEALMVNSLIKEIKLLRNTYIAYLACNSSKDVKFLMSTFNITASRVSQIKSGVFKELDNKAVTK